MRIISHRYSESSFSPAGCDHGFSNLVPKALLQNAGALETRHYGAPAWAVGASRQEWVTEISVVRLWRLRTDM